MKPIPVFVVPNRFWESTTGTDSSKLIFNISSADSSITGIDSSKLIFNIASADSVAKIDL